MRPFLFGQPLLVILLTVASAAAQTAPAAEALYHRGVADFQAGRYEAACRALAESYRLEALPGVLFTLATCEARAGRVASSAAHYQDFLQLVSRLPEEQRALQREREAVALAERRALLPDVPSLFVEASGPVPPGARLYCDGVELGDALLGRELPLDPGHHVLAIELSDGTRSELPLDLARKEHLRLRLPVPAPRAALTPSLREQRLGRAAYVSLGLGSVALATGIVAGSLAWKHKREVDDHCDGHLCDSAGKNAADRAQVEALASTVGYALGAASLSTYVVLALVRSRARVRALDRHGARLSLSPSGLALGARF